MTRKCILLLKVQLYGFMGAGKVLHSGDRKQKKQAVLMSVLWTIVLVIMTGYSVGLAYSFTLLGLVEMLPVFMLTMSSVLTVILTFLKSNGLLFGMKDYDQVMSLPVSKYTVVLSRVLSIYLFNFLAGCLIMLPSGYFYCQAVRPDPGQILILLSLLFLAPLLPMALTMALASGIIAVSVRFRHSNLMVILLSMAAILLLLAGSFRMSAASETELAGMGQALLESFLRIYPANSLLLNALNDGGSIGYWLFAALSAAALTGFILVTGRYYNQINTAIFSHTSGKSGRLKDTRKHSAFTAMYYKELRRYISCPIYVVNSATGAAMLLFLAIALPSLHFDTPDMQMLEEILYRSLPFIMAFCTGIAGTTGASMSMEGKSRFLMCAAPVPPMTVFLSKTAVNLTVMLPASVLSSFIITITTKPGWYMGLWIFLTPAVYSVFASIMGMFYGQKYPQYDWSTEYHAVKGTSANLTLPAFTGMGATMAPILLTQVLPDLSGFLFPLCTGVIAVWSFIYYRRLTSCRIYM